MYHSLIFQIEGQSTRYNTWDNWHLIPSSRPVVVLPTPKYTYVEIPGSNTPLDLTEYLTGGITYSTRKGQFEFYVSNDGKNWAVRRTELASFFNGRKMRLTLEDDPLYYYKGRFFLKDWRSESSSNYSRVTIEYEILPYRYANNGKEAGL